MTMSRALTSCYLLVIAMLAPTLRAAVTQSAGCGKALASGTYQLTDQNVTRTYRVFVPTGYKPSTAYPMVMVFHGWGGNENEFLGDRNVTTHSAPIFRAIAPIIGLPHRGYLDTPGKSEGMPVLVITGMQDTTVPPGAWEDTSHTTTSDGDRYYYTGASAITQRWGTANSCPYASTPAASFSSGINQADCRTYCGRDAAGWSRGSAGIGWPNVLDCRAAMGHTYSLSWSWKLVLDFFDAHSR